MEWVVLLLIALAAAAYVALPRPASDVSAGTADELRAERAGLLALLRELDDDAAAGRISPEDRAEGRRALAPRLRQVTEALDELGEPREIPGTAAAADEPAEGEAEPGPAEPELAEARPEGRS